MGCKYLQLVQVIALIGSGYVPYQSRYWHF